MDFSKIGGARQASGDLKGVKGADPLPRDWGRGDDWDFQGMVGIVGMQRGREMPF